MKSEAQEYLDRITDAETHYEKGRIAAEMYCWLHHVSPASVKAEIERSAREDAENPDVIGIEDRKEMDRGGLAWCVEQLEKAQ